MRARSFFYVCAGVLMLAIAYDLEASRAEAQLGGEFAGISTTGFGGQTLAITSTGDVYARTGAPVESSCNPNAPMVWKTPCGLFTSNWQFMGNVLGGTISVKPSTMGEVKGKYREEDT